MTLVSHTQTFQSYLPLCFVGQDLLAGIAHRFLDLLWQILSGHVFERFAIQHVVGAVGAQQLKKIDPALGVGALEPPEPL